jgi:hypothetical protein
VSTECTPTVIHGCPCGESHEASVAIERDLRRNGTRRAISTLKGTFLVPYEYITFHGVDSVTLPEMAARYGFERVRNEEG